MRPLLPALALTSAIALTGCSSSSSDEASDPSTAPSPSTSPSSSPSSTPTSSSAPASPSDAPSQEPAPAGPLLSVQVDGDQVTPNAEELTVTVGQPLLVEVTADRAGELHVHSKPEQYVDFTEGDSSAELVIDVPGTVEIEEHETGAVVAQVEVRP